MTTTSTAPAAAADFDWSGWRELARRGVTGACVPVEDGGLGLGARQTADLLEQAGHDLDDTGLVFAAAAHLLACCMPIAESGSDRTRAELLPALSRGDLVAANAMTEPEAGSDVSRLRTTARATDGGFVVSGVKSYVSNAPVADVLVTYACTDPGAAFLGNTALVVDARAAGVTIAPFVKMGLDGCPGGSVTFDDVFVPDHRVLATPGAGGAVFQASMGWERACLFALYLGQMSRQTQRCVEHLRTRHQGGSPLATRQVLTHRVAQMHRRFLAARALLHAATDSIDRGAPDPVLIAASKVTTSEAAVANAADAVQLFGGAGYLTAVGVETALRDAVPGRIFSGTNEIQDEIIAKGIGL